MQAVLYEDSDCGLLGPLTLLRPQFDVRCGALLLREKLERRRPDWHVALLPRPALRDLVAEKHPDRGPDSLSDEPTLLLLARVVVSDELLSAVEDLAGDVLLTAGGETVGARLEGEVSSRVARLSDSPGGIAELGLTNAREVPARTIKYPWDLVALTPSEIGEDATLVGRLGDVGEALDPDACAVRREAMAIGEGSSVAPGAVLDASDGPILIGRDVRIMPNAVVMGPAALGDRTRIKCGARILGGTSLGEECRIGGEVEGSVFQGWANKQHDGFLGHSYVGSWVNIGAGTDNSDLKNNYGRVRVVLNGKEIDTGRTFVGAVIGDHSKTAIGTTINTGTIIGVFCNVLDAGFPPKFVPSFSWGTASGLVEHDLEKAIQTARVVMGRRGVELTAAEEALARSVFDDTRCERKKKPPA
jgi:UDP-N-acetylglucosamine diphosphorylase/glucosamine-1-phosphate N-acetyltransferase